MPKQVFCSECKHYEGTEKVPNPKSTAWVDACRPKCKFGLSKTANEADYHCTHYEPNEDKTETIHVKCLYCRKFEDYNALYDCEWDAIICKLCGEKFKYDFSQGKDVVKEQYA